MIMTRSVTLYLLALAAVALAPACGEPAASPAMVDAATGVTVTISPSSADVGPASAVAFAAAVTGTVDTSVRWSVTEVGGGVVDASGHYVAPASAGTYHVVVQSMADVTRTATATVTVTAAVTPPPPPAPAGSCAAEPQRTTGTTYYVCDCATGAQAGCVAGNDSYSGTSPGTPWRSWSKAMSQFNTMAAGSTVALCRGGSWTGLGSTTIMRNLNCRADSATRPPAAGDVQTCNLRDYTPSSGASALPRLAFSSGIFMEMGWYEESGGGWTAPSVTGVRILNLDVVGNGGNVQGVYPWGRVRNMEICGNNFRDGVNNAYYGVTTMTISYVNFHHNRITNNPYGIGPITGTSCVQSCWFDSNYMDMNGGGENRDHSIYVQSSPYGGPNWPTAVVGPNPRLCQGTGGGTACYAVAKDTRITNNEIRRSAWGPGGTGCNASAIVIHTPHDDLLIENNLVYEPPGTANGGCYGIDQTAGIDMPGAWNRTIIRRNQVYNVGGNGITIGNCRNCVIEDNLVVGGSQGIQYPDPGNRCSSVSYPPTANYNCSGNLSDTGGIVRNNTVYNGGDITINSMSAAVVANNAVCGGGISTPAGATNDHNLTGATCAGWFQSPGTNPATANFKPGAPLANTGGTVSEGSRYISVQPWSATDAGSVPSGTPSIGAVR